MRENIERQKIGYSTVILGIGLIFAFTFCWILPDAITNLMKPVMMLGILSASVIKRKALCLSRFSILLILDMAYNVLSCFLIPGSDFARMISVNLNLLFCAVVTACRFRENELLFLLVSVKYASLLLAFGVMISNPLIGSLHSAKILLLGTQINKNAVAYLIAPGLLISVTELLYTEKKKKQVLLLLQTAVMIYGGIYPMSRGGFLAVSIPPMLMLGGRMWRWLRTMKLKKILLFSAGLVIGLTALYHVMPKEYVSRLLDQKNYRYSNSGDRDSMAEEAMEMVEDDILFGKGFGYYTKMTGNGYGTHCVAADLYVATGLAGVVLFAGLFLYLVFYARSNLERAWIIMALISVAVESQFSYSIWVPVILSYLLAKYYHTNGQEIYEKR